MAALRVAADAAAVAIERGHGAAIGGTSIQDTVHTSVHLKINAQIQTEAMQMGGDIIYLSEGEIAEMRRSSAGHARAWEYWTRRAGIAG